MTNSAIITNINENFPVPGVDNDTQVFRDNFATIKTSLTSAKAELTDLLTHAARKDDAVNDLNGNVISNAVLTKTSEKVYNFNASLTAQFDVDFNNGPYQLAEIGTDVNVNLVNFPTGSTKNGRVTLHLTSTSSHHNMVTFTSTNGTSIKFDENFPRVDDSTLPGPTHVRHLAVTSATNPVIVEIWKFDTAYFIKYIGFFS